MSTRGWRFCVLSAALLQAPGVAAQLQPENLAIRATVTATSEFSAQYAAAFVADGIIPVAGRRDGAGKEWAVRGDTHRDGAELTMQWPGPVTVAEIVYFGRSSYAVEAWKRCEVRLDESAEAVAGAEFKPGHGPQRIRLSEPRETARIRLTFVGHHTCSNPGAAEIQVYSATPPESLLGTFVPLPPMHGAGGPVLVSMVDESPDLAATLYAGKLGFRDLLLVQRHAFGISHVYTYHVEGFKPGGGIYTLTPRDGGGELARMFDAGNGEVMDIQLSYDAREVLFSYKRRATKGLNHMSLDPDTKFQVFRMDVGGTNVRQLTRDSSNNFNPCWLPDGGIAFLSDRKLSFAYCFTTSSPLLYRMNDDGTQVRKLSHGYLNDFTPSVLNDGRIIYSRWEYVDRPACPIQSLWTMRPDGSQVEGFFGNRVLEPGTFMEARSIGHTPKVLCVLTGHNGCCRGALGVIDPRLGGNAQEAIRSITPELNIGSVVRGNGNGLLNRGPYENPFPLDDTHFLVSKMGTVILRDYDGTEKVTLIEPRDGMGFYSPQPVRAVAPPPAVPSLLRHEAGPWASVLVQDVYNGLVPDVARGEIRQIAVVEEIEKGDFAPHTGIFGFQFPLVSCGATYAAKKLWGYADVEQDGSAHFTVPTGRPIYFLALDGEGRAVQRMRTFTHFQPGEEQSCIGCHADRNYTATRNAKRPSAALRAPQELAPPEWGRRNFDYTTIVQPVLDKYCIECHGSRNAPKGVDLTGDRTDFFCVSYEHLARKGTHGEKEPFRHGVASLEGVGRNPYVKWMSSINGAEQNVLMIEPRTWGAYPSKLTGIVLGGHPDGKGRRRFTMDRESVRRLMAWMDLNVPYYRDSRTNHPGQPGSRMMRPPKLDDVLEDVRRRRCAECHDKVPRPFYTRITNVEENSFLWAPLAKSAGGGERCGKPVFQSKSDPDYVAIVRTFEPIAKLMAERPRLDFPNAQYVPHAQVCPAKLAARTP